MSSLDSSVTKILNDIVVYLNLYILSILYVLCNIGNILSVVIFSKKIWRKNVCVFYFLICIIIDSCYINSGMLSSIFTFGLNINAQNSNVFLCKILYYVAYVFSALLPTVLILASIDRLLISSQNVDTRLYSSKRLAYFSVSISICIWTIFYIHTLIKVDIFQFYPSVFICYYDTSGFYFEFNYYSNVFISVILSIGLILMSILAFKNVRRIRAVPRQQRQRIRTMNKKDFQLLRCLYVYDIVYIIFITFPSIYGVYQAATRYNTKTSTQQTIESFILSFLTFTHHIPYGANFFIFISVSKAFRQEIKRLGQKLCNQNLIAIQEEQNEDRNNVELVVVSTVKLPA